MERVIELDNKNFMKFDSLYYKGECKQEILKNKSEIIKKIPKENILGFGYTVEELCSSDGILMSAMPSAESVCEYAFISLNKKSILNEKVVLCVPLLKIIFRYANKEMKIEEYKSDLDELGYIELPLDFKFLENNRVIELFEDSKVNTKKK